MHTPLFLSSSSVDPQASMAPIIQKGQNSHQKKIYQPWSLKDDERLLNGIREFGTQWKKTVKKYFTSDGYQRDYDSCQSRWKHCWQLRYEVTQIKAIKEEIQLEEMREKGEKGREKTIRRIINLANHVRQPGIPPIQINGPTVSDSQPAISTTLLQSPQGSAISKRKPKRHWSVEEDERLLNGIRKFGIQWKEIADKDFTSEEYQRDHTSCQTRWTLYWKKRYKVTQIQAIKEEIRVEVVREKGKKGKEKKIRRIINLANRVIQTGIPPSQTNGLAMGDSQHAISTTLLQSPLGSAISEQEDERNLPRGRWSVEEDKCLLNGIREFGPQWKEITKKYFTSDGQEKRDFQSCSNRWHSYWKKHYTMEQIQAIKEIRLEENETTKERKIINLSNRVIQASIPPIQINGPYESDLKIAKVPPIDSPFVPFQVSEETTDSFQEEIDQLSPAILPSSDQPIDQDREFNDFSQTRSLFLTDLNDNAFDPLEISLSSNQPRGNKRSWRMASLPETAEYESDSKIAKVHPSDSPIVPSQTSEETTDSFQEEIDQLSPALLPSSDQPIAQDQEFNDFSQTERNLLFDLYEVEYWKGLQEFLNSQNQFF